MLGTITPGIPFGTSVLMTSFTGTKTPPATYTLYYSEFHANLGGILVTMAVLLASVEVFKSERSNWPWICLLTCDARYHHLGLVLFHHPFFLRGSLVLALMARRLPHNWRFVCIASGSA